MSVDLPLTIASRYRMVHHRARGGMGDVWEAWDEILHRPVALKLLRADLGESSARRTRFRGEAQAAARLSHPGAVNVFDYGERDGIEYLVMELVDGESLSAVIRRHGKLTVQEVMAVVAQTASVLGAAHALGMVHRDIKPANLLLQLDGRVKVTDFGIAHAADRPSVTDAGTVVGTASYMSPEQVRGGIVSASSDIYSLGIVAFQCLTGRAPFGGNTPVEIARAHLHDPVPPFPTPVPAPVERLVRAMLEKDPSRRPDSARAVADGAARLAAASGEGPDRRAAGALDVRHAPTSSLSTCEVLQALALGLPRAQSASVTTPDDDWPTQRRPHADHAPSRTPDLALGALGATASGQALRSAHMRGPGGTGGEHEPTALHRPARWRRPAIRARRRGTSRRRGRAPAALVATSALALVVGGLVLTAGAEPVHVRVPRLDGHTMAAARRLLTSSHLAARSIERDVVGADAGHVVAQRPRAGVRVARGTRVQLTVASGYVDLSETRLLGDAYPAAAAAVRRDGLVPRRSLRSPGRHAARAGDVVGLHPLGRLHPGTVVTLEVAGKGSLRATAVSASRAADGKSPTVPSGPSPAAPVAASPSQPASGPSAGAPGPHGRDGGPQSPPLRAPAPGPAPSPGPAPAPAPPPRSGGPPTPGSPPGQSPAPSPAAPTGAPGPGRGGAPGPAHAGGPPVRRGGTGAPGGPPSSRLD